MSGDPPDERHFGARQGAEGGGSEPEAAQDRAGGDQRSARLPPATDVDHRPLIVTADVDEATFNWLDGLRRRHFPPERNHLAAHLTLFHALPGSCRVRVVEELDELTRDHAPIDGLAGGWMPLGRGVAMALDVPALVAVRAELARRLQDILTRQDAAGFRPHVTVQNKVAPADARALRRQLEAVFLPRAVRIPALALWRYDGGPWEFDRRFTLAHQAERLAGDSS